MRKLLIFASLLLSYSLVLGQDEDERTRLVISTDSGEITVELYNETPSHRDNFIKLANESFYDGTTFHRVMEEFMIQGGNPSTKEGAEDQKEGPGYTVPMELHGAFFHKKGALCAARQPDNVNPKRASSGSQFYIVHGKPFTDEDLDMFEKRANQDMRNRAMQAFFAAEENKEYLARVQSAQRERNQDAMQVVLDEVNPMIDAWMGEKKFKYSEEQREVYKTLGGAPHLDQQYTVFGEVVSGLDVVDKIAMCKKEGSTPNPPIRMSVRVIE